MDLKREFGLRLKEIRQSKKITQEILSEIVEIDPKHLSHIETGKSFPKADLIERFAKALNVDYTVFFETEHIKNKQLIVSEINKFLCMADTKQLQKIYKIILACFE